MDLIEAHVGNLIAAAERLMEKRGPRKVRMAVMRLSAPGGAEKKKIKTPRLKQIQNFVDEGSALNVGFKTDIKKWLFRSDVYGVIGVAPDRV